MQEEKKEKAKTEKKEVRITIDKKAMDDLQKKIDGLHNAIKSLGLTGAEFLKSCKQFNSVAVKAYEAMSNFHSNMYYINKCKGGNEGDCPLAYNSPQGVRCSNDNNLCKDNRGVWCYRS